MKSYLFTGLEDLQVSSHRANGDHHFTYVLNPSPPTNDLKSAILPSLTDSTMEDSNTRVLRLNIGIPTSADFSSSRLEISFSSFTEEPSERSEDRSRIQEIRPPSTVIESSILNKKDIKVPPFRDSRPEKPASSMFQETVDDWNSEVPIFELEEVKPPARRRNLTNGVTTTTKSERSPMKLKITAKGVPKSDEDKSAMMERIQPSPLVKNSRRSLLASSCSVRHPRVPPEGTSIEAGRTADTRWARWSSTRMLRGISTRGLVKKGGV
jgi:hypothetical protein